MAQGVKPPKTAIIIGLVLLLVSLASCGFGAISFVSVFSDVQNAVSDADSHMSGSVVEVSQTDGWVLTFGDDYSFSCEVHDENGQTVAQNADAGNVDVEGDNKGEPLYLLGAFEADSSNSYEVMCRTSAENGKFVVISVPSLGVAVPALFGFGIGALSFLVGGIFLIVGLIRRGKWKRDRRQSGGLPGGGPNGPPPPGGYGGAQTWQGAPVGYPPAPGQAPSGPSAPGQFPPPPGQFPPPTPGQFPPPTPGQFPPPTPPPAPGSGPGSGGFPPPPPPPSPFGPSSDAGGSEPPTQQPPPFG